jgi:hypothetical protein
MLTERGKDRHDEANSRFWQFCKRPQKSLILRKKFVNQITRKTPLMGQPRGHLQDRKRSTDGKRPDVDSETCVPFKKKKVRSFKKYGTYAIIV